MLTTIAMFFSSKLGKIIGIVLMALTVIALIYSAITSYNRGIANRERIKIQNQQLSQVIKDNEELHKKLDELSSVNQHILADTTAKNSRVIERHTRVETYIDSPEAQSSNRQSSKVLKNTIRMLKNEED